MIELFDIYKSYGQRRLFNGVSLSLPKNGITAFLGANGSGKTSLMDIICGCVGVDSGKVLIGGMDIDVRPNACKKLIGYVPEAAMYRSDQTPIEAMRYIASLYGVNRVDLDKCCEEAVGTFNLQSVASLQISQLSKGVRQRISLACALVHKPKILVLDEPTDGLDPSERQSLISHLKDISGSCLIFLSSHALAEVQGFCDDLVLIKDGSILAQDSLESMTRHRGNMVHYEISPGNSVNGLKEYLEAEIGRAQLSLGVKFGLENKVKNTLEIQMIQEQSDSVLDLVCQAVFRESWGLKRLVRVEKSLEDLYFELSQDRGVSQ